MIDLLQTYTVLFLPGNILLLKFKNRLNFSVSECIIFGSILWNYLFLLSSIIVGLFSDLLKIAFLLFSFASILLIIAVISTLMVNKLSERYIRIKIYLDRLFLYISLFSLFSLNFLLLYYHSIIYEWDAVYYYLPAAKSIQLSGSLSKNIYRQLSFLDVSPLVPLLYAYVINYYNDLSSVYVIPTIFYILTLLGIWILVKELMNRKMAIISIIIFLSVPSVSIVLGARALYLDIPFHFYLLTTIILLVKLMKSLNSYLREFLIIILGMSVSLMFATRIELGLFIIFTIIATLLTILQIKYYKILACLVLGFPYFMREIRNILITNNYTDPVIRLIPTMGIILIFFILLKIKLAKIEIKSPLKKYKSCYKMKLIILFAVMIIPCAVFFIINNIIKGGFITRGVSVSKIMLKAVLTFRRINPVVTVHPYTDMFNWQNMLIAWWTVTPFTPSFAIGVFYTFLYLIKSSKINTKYSLIIFTPVFLGLFNLWILLHCDPQPRRLFYFSVFYTLLIVYGFKKIQRRYSAVTFAIRISLYLALMLLITWNKYPLKSINDMILLYSKTYNTAYDIDLFLYSIFSFLIIFFPYEKYIKIRIVKRIPIYSMIILLLILLYLNNLIPLVTDVIYNDTSSLRFKNFYMTYYCPDVINYYKESINDTGTTLCFHCHELITFANRSIIDLTDPTYSWFIYSITEESNELEILSLFTKYKIKYILLPNQNNQFYDLYQNIIHDTSLKYIFKVVNLQLLAKFKYVTLYQYRGNYSKNISRN